ncbi:MAG: hypothetical protein Q7S18_03555 [bacterium]|nr:hypothetical protein [bacterium]
MKSSGKPKVYRDYTRYLKKMQKENCDKGVTIDFYVKDGKLFRKRPGLDLNLGKIVMKDENFVYVQKTLIDSVCPYRRECVREEDDGQMK